MKKHRQRRNSALYKMACIFVLLVSAFASRYAIGAPNAVSAVGFVEPQGGIINVSGTSSSTSAIVSELKVAEGDLVDAGQIVAILDSYHVLQATVKQAEAEVTLLQAKLDLVEAGSSKGTINAQKARIERIQSEIETADTKCSRAENLRKQGVISESGSEDACLNKQLLQSQLREAKASLAALTEVRDVDIAVAYAGVGGAEAALLRAQTELEHSIIRVPVTGRVLKLYAKAGERIGSQGLLQLGQTESMWVRAEVYETEIGKVKLGQQATITSDVFPGELHGTVKGIGLQIGKNQFNTVMSDSRVVEVKIKLGEQDSPIVANLTNLQVSVVIATEE